MRKIRLNLDTLAVESFQTTEGERAERGTIHGHDSSLGHCIIACSSPMDPDSLDCHEPLDPSYSGDGGCICQQMVNDSRDGNC